MSRTAIAAFIGTVLGCVLAAPAPAQPTYSVPSIYLPILQNLPPSVAQGSIRAWGEAELLMWWLRDRPLPALVTTSTSQSSLGVLGQPDTRVLFGGSVDGEVRYGARLTAGVDFTLQNASGFTLERWGLEAVYFFLDEHANGFSATSTGNPVLARPFFDVITGQQSSQQVGNLQVGSIPPGPGPRPDFALAFTGSITVDNPSRFYGAELNVTYDFLPDGRGVDGGFWIAGLAGWRHLGMEEELSIREDLALPAATDLTVAPPQVVLPETAITIIDEFRTRNYFYGPQFGFRSGYRAGPVTLNLAGKMALGWIEQSAEIRGSNLIQVRDIVTGQFLAPESGQGGLLAQPTNIGKYRRARFCIVPEMTFDVGCELRTGMRLFAGYNFLYVQRVLRPGDQIDTGVDVRIRSGGDAPTDATQPAFTFRPSDLWLQGIQVGLDIRY